MGVSLSENSRDNYLLRFLRTFLVVLTACIVIASTRALRAAIMFRIALTRGKIIVNEKTISLWNLKKSTPSQIWNPISINAVSIHTLAWRNQFLKQNPAHIPAVRSIISIMR